MKGINKVSKLLVIVLVAYAIHLPVFAENVTIEVEFNEALQYEGANYYLDEPISDQEEQANEATQIRALIIKNANSEDYIELYYGMSERAVEKILGSSPEDSIVVLSSGDTPSTPNQKHRTISELSFKYQGDVLYEVIINAYIEELPINNSNRTASDIFALYGLRNNMSTYNEFIGKGIVEYKRRNDYIHFYFENFSVDRWGVSILSKRDEKEWLFGTKSFQMANTLRNINGNILNGGLATYDDEFIYYAQPNEMLTSESLYKMTFDGIERVELSPDRPRDLNRIYNRLYYSNQSDLSANGQGKIYSIETDGSDRKQLTPIGASNIQTNQLWLFFLSLGDADHLPGLYKITRSGEYLTLLKSGDFSQLNLGMNAAFYLENKSNPLKTQTQSVIKRFDLLENVEEDIYTGFVSKFLMNKERLFYTNSADRLNVYVLNWQDKGERIEKKITSVGVVGLNQNGSSLYFQTVFNEYMWMKDCTYKGIYLDNQHQYNNLTILGDYLLYQESIDDIGRVFFGLSFGQQCFELKSEIASEDVVMNTRENDEGMILKHNDWIYYVNTMDRDSLYRVNSEDGQIERITEDEVSNLFVHFGKVYFVLESLSDAGNRKLMCFDEEKQRIISLDQFNKYYLENWITMGDQYIVSYSNDYTTNGFTSGVFFVDKEENTLEEKQQFTGYNIEYISNNAYFIRDNDGAISYMRELSDLKATYLLRDIKIINAWDDTLYYTSLTYGEDGLYRMNIKTRVIETVNTLPIWEAIIVGNQLIYTNKEDRTLYVSNLDGSEKKRLVDENANEISYVDGWIFFHDYKEQKRIRMDASELEILGSIAIENK